MPGIDDPFRARNAPWDERGREMQSQPQMSRMSSQALSEAQQQAAEQSEGPIARAIESETARLPSDVFLWAAVAAMAASGLAQLRGRRQWSSFFGQWVAPLLLFGVYNKVVKVAGSDRTQRATGV
jgi:hypothetical protein